MIVDQKRWFLLAAAGVLAMIMLASKFRGGAPASSIQETEVLNEPSEVSPLVRQQPTILQADLAKSPLQVDAASSPIPDRFRITTAIPDRLADPASEAPPEGIRSARVPLRFFPIAPDREYEQP